MGRRIPTRMLHVRRRCQSFWTPVVTAATVGGAAIVTLVSTILYQLDEQNTRVSGLSTYNAIGFSFCIWIPFFLLFFVLLFPSQNSLGRRVLFAKKIHFRVDGSDSKNMGAKIVLSFDASFYVFSTLFVLVFTQPVAPFDACRLKSDKDNNQHTTL